MVEACFRWSKTVNLQESGIIVGSDMTQEWLLPWWWDHYTLHNNTPVTFIDFGLSKEAKAWCKEKGTLLPLYVDASFVIDKEDLACDVIDEMEAEYGKSFWHSRNAWFKKPLACLRSPYRFSLWIDLDCQVQKDLSPLFAMLKNGHTLALLMQSIEPGTNQMHFNSGVIAFQRGISIFEKWAKLCFEENNRFLGDQDALSELIYKTDYKAIQLDPMYNWSRCLPFNPDAAILHWHGNHGKTIISSLIQKKNLEFLLS